MSTVKTIKRDIQRAIAQGRVTKTELANKADIPLTTLIGMERETWNPLSANLERLEVALHDLLSRKSRPRRAAGCGAAA